MTEQSFSLGVTETQFAVVKLLTFVEDAHDKTLAWCSNSESIGGFEG